VEQVHAGQIWANSSELAEFVEALSQLAPLRIVNADGMRLLTEREDEVVRLVAEGLQNREIARQLKVMQNGSTRHSRTDFSDDSIRSGHGSNMMHIKTLYT
jgi:DNA-binding NarL/FixJ family response regulator